MGKASTSSEWTTPSNLDIEKLSKEKTEFSNDDVNGVLIFQFLLIGIVSLIGYNFMLTEQFNLQQALGGNFGFYMAFVNGAALNVGQLLMIFFGKRFPFAIRIWLGALAIGLSQVCIGIICVFSTPDNGIYALCAYLGVFLMGSGGAIYQSTTLGLAAMGPSIFVTMVMVGEGIAGLIGWPLQRVVITILELQGMDSEAGKRNTEMLILFVFAAAAIGLSALTYTLFTRKQPMIRELLKVEEGRKARGPVAVANGSSRTSRQIVWATFPQAFNIWLNFTLTFLVFPGVVTQWTSASMKPSDFLPLVFYVFQIVDTIGRLASTPSLKLNVGPKTVRWLVFGRAVFVPLFILIANASGSDFFYQDWLKYVVMALFALSNGSVTAWIMLHGPAQVAEDEQEVAGYTMSFSLVFGILSGSILALNLQK